MRNSHHNQVSFHCTRALQNRLCWIASAILKLGLHHEAASSGTSCSMLWVAVSTDSLLSLSTMCRSVRLIRLSASETAYCAARSECGARSVGSSIDENRSPQERTCGPIVRTRKSHVAK